MATARSKIKGRCYYCGEPATSREHAPPKALFRGFDCDSITVPSCNAHNNGKDHRDQAIAIALAEGLREAGKRHPLPLSVQASVDGLLRGRDRVRNSVRLLDVQDREELSSFRLSYLAPQVRFREWVKQLTAALVYDATRQVEPTLDWSRAHVDSPHWVDATSDADPELSELADKLSRKRVEYEDLLDLPWIAGWSAQPRPYPQEIYKFEFLCGHGAVVFRHTLFSSYVWYVVFVAPERTATSLLQKGTRLAGPDSNP